MRFFALVSAFFAAVVFAATPDCEDSPCMTGVEAQDVATRFGTLIKDFKTSDAEQWLTEDFIDYSSSVNTLINFGCTAPQPLNAATFTSRDAFIAGQGAQKPIPFHQLNLWHNCDTVFLRWRSTIAPGVAEAVTGIIVLEVEYSGSNFLVKTVYSEFNSGAWLVDLGTFTPNCSASKRSIVPLLPLRMA